MAKYTTENTVIQDTLDYSSKILFPRTEIGGIIDYKIVEGDDNVTGERLINKIVMDGSNGMTETSLESHNIPMDSNTTAFLVGVLQKTDYKSTYFKVPLSPDSGGSKYLNASGKFSDLIIPSYDSSNGIEISKNDSGNFVVSARLGKGLKFDNIGAGTGNITAAIDTSTYTTVINNDQICVPLDPNSFNLPKTPDGVITIKDGATLSSSIVPGNGISVSSTVSQDGKATTYTISVNNRSTDNIINVDPSTGKIYATLAKGNNAISISGNTIGLAISSSDGNSLSIKTDGLYVTAPEKLSEGTGISISNNIVAVRRSTKAGNALTFDDGALYVAAPGEAPDPITYNGSNSIDVNNETYTITTKIDSSTNNALSVLSNGLFVAKPVASKDSNNAVEIKSDGIYVKKGASVNTSPETQKPYYLTGILGASDTNTLYSDVSGVGAYFMDGGLYAPSDERLKNIQENLFVNLDNLATIKKIKYTWKSDPNKIVDIGVTAQSVEALYPELVSTVGDKKAVQYSKLGVVALGGIDALYNKMKKMEKRIKELEERLDECGM